jgi:TonB-linked SusC/RagA family outer membrane protein
MNKAKPIQYGLLYFMKISFLQLAISFLTVAIAYAVDSRGQEVLEKPVSISVENTELQDVLSDIEKQTGVKFTYSPKLIGSREQITLHVEKVKLSEALATLFESKITYKVVGEKQISLKPSKKIIDDDDEEILETSYKADLPITGKVADRNGTSLPGVNILIKGTGIGTTTDSQGNYSLSVPGPETVLIISFIGFAPQEITVGNQTVIDIVLQEDITQLNEVVVTALGVEKETKSLGYSVTEVQGESLTQAREINAANALAGRIAGVNVSKIASGPAGSSRVVIRGAKTLGSTLNQPLYVVDGVPIDNSNFGQAGMWGGADQGDGLSSINPDDIASMTVLKGGASAALYGSRAANGVILITTKKGSGRKGLGIEFNSNYVFEIVNNLTDFQHEYGTGGYVGPDNDVSVATKAASIDDHWLNGSPNPGSWGLNGWGPRLDGSQVVQFDGVSREYSYKGDNWKRFFQTGNTFTNTIALAGGNEMLNVRTSISSLQSKGVIPNSGYDRINLSLATNSRFGEKITLNSKMLYSREETTNRPNLSDSPGNGIFTLYHLPNDVDVRDLIGDPSKPGSVPSLADQAAKGITIYDNKAPGEEFQIHSFPYIQNPYWAAWQLRNSDVRDRIIASGRLRYDITDFLYVQAQGGLDHYTLRGTRLLPQGTGYDRGGWMSENESRRREVNLEVILGFAKTFGKFGTSAFVGGNTMRRTEELMSLDGSAFNTPMFAAINNARIRNFWYTYGKSGINSLYGSVEFSFNDYLFLTGTARHDRFSVLNPKDNAILYPSVTASFVFSEATSLPTFISFGKVRASWAQVGNVSSVAPYSTKVLYAASNTHMGLPFGGFTSGDNYPNVNLKPFTSSEKELGLDLKFFDNRLGLDVTYYNQKTTDDILSANVSRSSGFATTSINVGEITNKGFELLLTGTPVRREVTWDVSLNFAKNNSNVVQLIDGQTEVLGDEPRTRTVFIKHIVGMPYGMITGLVQMRDPNTGLLVYDADGTPQTDGKYYVIGSGVADFTGGVTNSISWKNFNLNFLIDFKSGGDIYSGTNVRMTQAGFTKQTLAGREGEAPLTVTGAIQNGTDGDGNPTYEPFTKTLTPGEANNYWLQLGERASDRFVYDASFIKLRQVILGYTIPHKALEKTPLQSLMISFVGRNLAFLYKNVDNIDPESNYSSSNSQGLDYFGMPSTRSYGFNLRATF